MKLALIAGEPGAGKTRLASEFASTTHRSGATVLFGRCDDGLAVPFQPFVEALSHYVRHTPEPALGSLAAELTRLVPALTDREPLKADPETEQYRLFEAVSEWLSAASKENAILLVLDDLHWATRPTLLMLRHLVRSSSERVMIVGTYRDTEPGPIADVLADLQRAGARQIDLGGLDVDDVIELVGEDGDAASIHAATAGNAFFVGELIRHHDSTGATPDSVRKLLAQRLSRLSDATREFLAHAAVAGEEFGYAILSQCLDNPEPALEEAVAAQIVSEVPGPGLRYRFAHALVRSAIEDELTAVKRARLHQRIGEAIEVVHADTIDDHVADLARHFTASAELTGAGKASNYLIRAGEQALSRHANEDAVSFFTAALNHLDSDPLRKVDLLTALGEAQKGAGVPTYREPLLQAAAEARAAGDAERTADALIAVSRGISSFAPTDRELVDSIRQVIDALPPGDSPRRAVLHSVLALELTDAAEQDERRRLGEEALAIARRLDDSQVLARIVGDRFHWLGGLHLLDERLRARDELDSVGKRVNDLIAQSRAAGLGYLLYMEAGDPDAADRWLDESERLSVELRRPVRRWFAMAHRATRAVSLGDFDDAERRIREADAFGRRIGWPDVHMYLRQHLFGLRFEQGRLAELKEEVAEGERDAGDRPLAKAMLALLLSEIGELEAASAIVRPFLTSEIDAFPDLQVELAMFAIAAYRVGDVEGASKLLQILEPYPDRILCGALTWWGSVAHHLGMLSTLLERYDDAAAHFARAETMHERSRSPNWIARTRVEWASMLQSRDLGRAQELARAALDTANALGMARVAAQAQTIFAS